MKTGWVFKINRHFSLAGGGWWAGTSLSAGEQSQRRQEALFPLHKSPEYLCPMLAGGDYSLILLWQTETEFSKPQNFLISALGILSMVIWNKKEAAPWWEGERKGKKNERSGEEQVPALCRHGKQF